MRTFAVATLLSALIMGVPSAATAQTPPPPDPNFATKVTESPCSYSGTDPYEKRTYEEEGFGAQTNYTRYPGACRRMHFAYGPIVVKPGQNDVLVGPVSIEKPQEDGYITRFKPNLVNQNGAVPPVEQVHLHHGTWLSFGGSNDYGNSAFFAAGEEKTIAPFPRGFGMPVSPFDAWGLLYMVHSAVQQPMATWITYDVDFIPKAAGDSMGMKVAQPVWLDVRPSAYPVFNVQRKYDQGDGTCTWPRQKCADFDPFGKIIHGQGQPADSPGTDYTYNPSDFGFSGGATLIGIGGHLHPGGIENQIDLVRNGQSQRIYNGVPTYWSRTDHTQPGGPPTSWDFSMRVSGLPYYGVHLKPGDKLRSNAKYDTKIMSSYEDMGIAVGLLTPDNADGSSGASSVDAFTAPIDTSARCDSGGLKAATPTLCINGFYETHGHYSENANASGPDGATKLDAADGTSTTSVNIGDFLYLPGDLSTVGTTGIPTVKLGTDLTFNNLDSALIPHTITTCAYPCTGATGAAFPLPNGTSSLGRPVDFDSSELGFGAPVISGVKNEATWDLPVTADQGYKPGEIVTYFCRIHPSMRGAFKVVQ